VGTWRLLGEVTANFTADHDVIVVRGPYDNFRRIKFKVTNAPLNLTRLVVTYDNGEPTRQRIRIRSFRRSASCAHPQALPTFSSC
jgi:hypothetical protein